ncbi:MAG: hypothetical protein ABJA20_06835 [Novosphingobium sp.]
MLPALVARYPQMSDYPAHLARWHVMLNIGHSADLARFYRFTWEWTPNLGTDLLIRPLAAMFGLELAGRILVATIPALLGLSFLATDLALNRRVGPGALLALATVWSPSLLLGFLNFSLAEALAFFAFALWIVLAGKRWRPALFLVIAPLVWLCHLSGWGILGVLVFGYEWSVRRGAKDLLRAILATWPLWPPAALLVFFGAGASGALTYGSGAVTDKLSNWVMGLRDQAAMLDLLTMALLVALPLIAWGRGLIDGRLGWAAVMLAVLTFVMPRHFGGGDFADYRLVPVALAAGCLAVRLPALSGRRLFVVMALAALPFAMRLAVTTAAWDRDSRQTTAMLGALDHVPQGAVVAGAWAYHEANWQQPPFSHLFAYATVRRDALTNAHFAIPGLHMLQLVQPDPAFVDPGQRIAVAEGVPVDLSQFAPAQSTPTRRAEYLWYIGDLAPSHLPAGAVIVQRTEHSLLARLANPVVRR